MGVVQRRFGGTIVYTSRQKKMCHEDLGKRLLRRYDTYLQYYMIFDRAMYGKAKAIPVTGLEWP